MRSLIEDRAMKTIQSIRVCVVACIIAVLNCSASFADDWTGKYMTEDKWEKLSELLLKGTGCRPKPKPLTFPGRFTTSLQ